MFTGIVEELGEVVDITEHAESSVLRIRGPLVTGDAGHGDSIAVNGVCLTLTAWGDGEFSTDVMAETLRASAVGDLRLGSPVNLERALRSDGRFGGHVVQGHVDTTTEVVSREPGDRWEAVTFALPRSIARYVVHKGSITLDGVSLTVSALSDQTFAVSLIPTTLELTTLGRRAVGDRVNVEVDVLAKYVERLLSRGASDV
ncbi:MAG: riboflavin synthase [Ornithinimicrobium sp.]|uniref:riboflavin synthase n=1 Tax=Ornithinimicrobium sp. TaxID=1977084 RepID=UPI003D9B5566